MPSTLHDAAMPPSKDAACDEPRTSHFELLKAVEVAHEMKDAAPGRRDSQHGTCDSQRLVAHDQELVQCRRKPTTSRLIHLLKAVEVAREVQDAAPGRQDTMHETSDSHRLVAHDDVLVQSWSKPHTSLLAQSLDAVEVARGTRHGTRDSHRLVASGHTILNFPEVLEGAEDRGHFAGLSAHPLSPSSTSSVVAGFVGGDTPAAMFSSVQTKGAAEAKGAPYAIGTKGRTRLQESKASSKDALRGFSSYCGWSYAFA